jgi:phage terminase small subunit
MGRKAKPVALKLIAGTSRPDRDPPDAPEFAPVRVFPDPPQHLNPDGAAAWNDLGPKLVAAGVLQEVDLYPLEQLCYSWQRFRQKAKAGMDMTASDDNALKALFSEFGMTPAARRRVAANLVDPDASPKQGNSFAGIGKRPA